MIRTIFKLFFLGMGVIFTLILLVSVYLFLFDPFHIRPLMTLLVRARTDTSMYPAATTADVSSPAVSDTTATPTPAVSKSAPAGPTAAQRQALESVGINPSAFPGGISATQLQCFTQILGASRVEAIKAGAVPTVAEFLAVRGCL